MSLSSSTSSSSSEGELRTPSPEPFLSLPFANDYPPLEPSKLIKVDYDNIFNDTDPYSVLLNDAPYTTLQDSLFASSNFPTVDESYWERILSEAANLASPQVVFSLLYFIQN